MLKTYKMINGYSFMDHQQDLDVSEIPLFENSTSVIEIEYYGECACHGYYKTGKRRGLPCDGRGYYRDRVDHLTYCGVHCPTERRIKLPMRPDRRARQQALVDEDNLQAKLEAEQRRAQGLHGKAVLYHMKMMKSVPALMGYIKVFPNYLHGSRKDGLGMPSLSPKAMGPVEHGQLGLPPAQCLENYHQANKVFPTEVDSAGNPLPSWYETQLRMYQDPTPHRHKFAGAPNAPLYSIHLDSSGTPRRYDYIGSRQFYCREYLRQTQRVGSQTMEAFRDMERLRQLLAEGWNLQICGYDAYGFPETGDLARDHLNAYEDPRSPY